MKIFGRGGERDYDRDREWDMNSAQGGSRSHEATSDGRGYVSGYSDRNDRDRQERRSNDRDRDRD